MKSLLRRLLGRDSEPIIVSFLSGPEVQARAMVEEVRGLLPEHPHYVVGPYSIAGTPTLSLAELRGKRIGLAPTLFTPESHPLRRAAFLAAPHKVLAYNEKLERHHLRPDISSILFLSGVPLDRIHLRPSWWPFGGEPNVAPTTHDEYSGRRARAGQPNIAILSPYFPYPLSHGGAVRTYNLLREAAGDFNLTLFAFGETTALDRAPILDLCTKLVIFPTPRYREPRWSTLLPPEVKEFRSPYVAGILRQHKFDLLQVEYTQLAPYRGDVLVEHDITFELYQQIWLRERTLRAWWDYFRWRRFEKRATARFRRTVVMSAKDAALLPSGNGAVIPNGVDLRRFRPEPEPHGQRLLFVGSFRHFPNVLAYRFFVEEVWPRLSHRLGLTLTVIDGPDAERYLPDTPSDARILRLGFIRDVVPQYAGSNLVIAPTQVSAGTNLKVLEAMAMERAVISTPSGCAGLGLEHGRSVWIANTPVEFAAGIIKLLGDHSLRRRLASAARAHAERHFDWNALGGLQKALWNELLDRVFVRAGTLPDLPAVTAIQKVSEGASHWEPESYLRYDLKVAQHGREVAGFIVTRHAGPDETEILNLAVAPQFRRTGIATQLIGSCANRDLLLEVRESNLVAQNLYRKLGFLPAGRREKYYDDPIENAVVMRLSRSLEHVNVRVSRADQKTKA